MTLRSSLAVLAFVLISCSSPTPVAPNGPFNGTWIADGIPSGAYRLLVLRQADRMVTGSVQDYGIGPISQLEDDGTVSGVSVDSTFDLQLRYRVAGTVRLSGTLTSADVLQALWTPSPPDTAYAWPLHRVGP